MKPEDQKNELQDAPPDEVKETADLVIIVTKDGGLLTATHNQFILTTDSPRCPASH